MDQPLTFNIDLGLCSECESKLGTICLTCGIKLCEEALIAHLRYGHVKQCYVVLEDIDKTGNESCHHTENL
jgi:hypothetical protein